MKDIINIPFKRKNTIDSDIFIPDRIEGEFIIFKNNARCSIEKFQTDFIKHSDNVSESIQSNEELKIDPETFFDTVSNDALIEQIINNPDILPTESSILKESKSIDENINNSQLINRINDDHVHDNQDININIKNEIKKENRLPEWDTFDRVKKTEEIEILVPFKIKLPKANQLSLLNDMFETSFTGYLAKQYIKDNIVNNSIALQKLLQSSIEEWIENELDGIQNKKTKNKKTTSKTTKESKTIESKTIEPESIEIKTESVQEESAMSFFNINQPKWDGDVKKLFAIQTEEQCIAVKYELDRLKEYKPNSIDIDKYEDMIVIYNEQLNTEPNTTK